MNGVIMELTLEEAEKVHHALWMISDSMTVTPEYSAECNALRDKLIAQIQPLRHKEWASNG
jgi:hypothetical protein